MLDVCNLNVTGRHGRVLLHDVSFSLPPGMLLAVVGPNGAGNERFLQFAAAQAGDAGRTEVVQAQFLQHGGGAAAVLGRGQPGHVGASPQEDGVKNAAGHRGDALG